ncbi:MAG TPA: MBL fold metallo-hydrolase [Jiangellaceae bacterium]
MRLTVLGCSGSLPGPKSPASSYLVEADGFRVLLDLGNGALGTFQEHAKIADVNAVLLSHLHPDHCLDLCSLYVARRFWPDVEGPPIPVWGPPDTAARMAAAYGLVPEPAMAKAFDFRTYVDGPFAVGPLEVRAAPVVHPVPAYALRVEHDGRCVAYSGDTAPTPALVDIASGADVFLCEASFRAGEQNPSGLHLTGQEAGEHAMAAGVGQLIVTHIPPWGDAAAAVAEASDAFGGPVAAARSGLVLDV